MDINSVIPVAVGITVIFVLIQTGILSRRLNFINILMIAGVFFMVFSPMNDMIIGMFNMTSTPALLVGEGLTQSDNSTMTENNSFKYAPSTYVEAKEERSSSNNVSMKIIISLILLSGALIWALVKNAGTIKNVWRWYVNLFEKKKVKVDRK